MTPETHPWYLLPQAAIHSSQRPDGLVNMLLDNNIPAAVINNCDDIGISFPCGEENLNKVSELLARRLIVTDATVAIANNCHPLTILAATDPDTSAIEYDVPESLKATLSDQFIAQLERLSTETNKDLVVHYHYDHQQFITSDDDRIYFNLFATPARQSLTPMAIDIRGIGNRSVEVYVPSNGSHLEDSVSFIQCPDTFQNIGCYFDNYIWVWVNTTSLDQVSGEFAKVIVDSFLGIDHEDEPESVINRSVDLLLSSTEVLKARAQEDLANTERRTAEQEKQYSVLLKEMRLSRKKIAALSRINQEDRIRLEQEITQIMGIEGVGKVTCSENSIHVITREISIYYQGVVPKEDDEDSCPECGDYDCGGCEEIDDEFKMGQYRITFNFNNPELETGAVKIYNIDYPNKDYPHPHVNSAHELCFGNARTGLLKYLAECELAAATQILINFLRSYNELDPYLRIERW